MWLWVISSLKYEKCLYLGNRLDWQCSIRLWSPEAAERGMLGFWDCCDKAFAFFGAQIGAQFDAQQKTGTVPRFRTLGTHVLAAFARSIASASNSFMNLFIRLVGWSCCLHAGKPTDLALCGPLTGAVLEFELSDVSRFLHL